MTIKNSQVEGLSRILTQLGTFTGVKLVYFVAMNLQRLQLAVAAIQTAQKPIPGYAEYEQRRNALCSKYADRDSQSRPIRQRIKVPGGEATIYDIVERREECDAALAILDSEFDVVRQARMAQEAEIHAFMQQEADVDLVKIKMSECPPETLTGDVAAVLMAAGILEWDIEKPGDTTEV